MSTLGDGLNVMAWITKRIDQVSAWAKKRGRENEVKKIDNAVDSHIDKRVNDILREINAKRERRTNSS